MVLWTRNRRGQAGRTFFFFNSSGQWVMQCALLAMEGPMVGIIWIYTMELSFKLYCYVTWSATQDEMHMPQDTRQPGQYLFCTVPTGRFECLCSLARGNHIRFLCSTVPIYAVSFSFFFSFFFLDSRVSSDPSCLIHWLLLSSFQYASELIDIQDL